MEKCVNSEYENDSSKSPETWAIQKENSNDCQEIKREAAGEVSRPRKKIARENRSIGWTEPGKAATGVRTDKLSKEGKRVRKLSVLNSKLVTGRRSVQNNTKTLHRNVPDRIGKYTNSNVRREAKLSGREPTENILNNCSSSERVADSDKHSDMSRDCSGTNLIATAGDECLNEKESGTLGNRIGSESGTENIFEKNFGDCLGSTSVVNDASSRGASNLETGDETAAPVKPGDVGKCSAVCEIVESSVEDDARMIENEKTPVKDEQFRHHPPDTPTKPKDHDDYYSHNKIRHVCGYCHKVFKSNGKLNSHVYSHTGERPFDCNNCGKAFSSKFKLVRHLLIHSEIRKFVCQICDRTFLRNDHLKNHYKIHDPQKKMYKCPKEDCDKEYSSLMSHKKHMAYHNVEDGDLKCFICGVKFETKEEVLFHLKSHSGSRLFKTQSDKKFKCDFCGRLFLTRKDVTRHLVVHTGERDFLCQFCPQRFGRKDHLVRHIKKSHLSDEMALKREMIEKNLTLTKRKTRPPATSTSRSEPEKQEENQQQQQGQEQRQLSPQPKQQEKVQQRKRKKQQQQPQRQPRKQRQQPSPQKQQLQRPPTEQQQPPPLPPEQQLQPVPPEQLQQPPPPEQQLQPLPPEQQQQPPPEQQMQPLPPEQQQQPPPEQQLQPPPPKQQKQQQQPSASKQKKKSSPRKHQQQEPQEEDEDEDEEEEEEEEEEDEGGDEKTHIVITVKTPMQKKKSKPNSSAKSKSFRKDPSVPKKKQVPLSKNKNSTTQIFLQNIPNILIIPNNSIILLRNQGSSSKAKKTDGDEVRASGNAEENTDTGGSVPTYDNQDRFQYSEDIASKSVPDTRDSASLMDTDPAVNYDCNMFQQPQFPNNFPFGVEVDNLENFQPDVTTFDQQPEDIGFDLVTASELLKKADAMTDPQEIGAPESPSESQSDLQRKVGVVKPMTKNIRGEMAKDLFEESTESLSLSDSILNDFKIDDSIILDNDGGMLNNLFGQSGVEATGNELLRSLLTNDNPIVAPLPGFNQIFNHGSN